MTRAKAIFLWVVVFSTAACGPAAKDEVEITEAWIPLDDGVRLAADIYWPAGANRSDKFPVLLEYLPYRKTESRARNYSTYSYFLDHGYIVARVDIRGTGNSEGVTIPYEYSDIELDDGEVVIDWLAQPGMVERQRRDVRNFLGWLQLHTDGDAQPARTQGLCRRHGNRIPVPGRRPLHGRHHAHRFVDDE